MRADPRPADTGRIPVHAALPVAADALHGGHARLGLAAVLAVVLDADGHVGERLGDGLLGPLVDVGADGGPEGPEDGDEGEDEEEVERELGVEGEDVRQVRVGFDEGEDCVEEG